MTKINTFRKGEKSYAPMIRKTIELLSASSTFLGFRLRERQRIFHFFKKAMDTADGSVIQGAVMRFTVARSTIPVFSVTWRFDFDQYRNRKVERIYSQNYVGGTWGCLRASKLKCYSTKWYFMGHRESPSNRNGFSAPPFLSIVPTRCKQAD